LKKLLTSSSNHHAVHVVLDVRADAATANSHEFQEGLLKAVQSAVKLQSGQSGHEKHWARISLASVDGQPGKDRSQLTIRVSSKCGAHAGSAAHAGKVAEALAAAAANPKGDLAVKHSLDHQVPARVHTVSECPKSEHSDKQVKPSTVAPTSSSSSSPSSKSDVDQLARQVAALKKSQAEILAAEHQRQAQLEQAQIRLAQARQHQARDLALKAKKEAISIKTEISHTQTEIKQ
jgi:DNA-directed RNA polymerase subunit M/transcription elongation factor TFIIS